MGPETQRLQGPSLEEESKSNPPPRVVHTVRNDNKLPTVRNDNKLPPAREVPKPPPVEHDFKLPPVPPDVKQHGVRKDLKLHPSSVRRKSSWAPPGVSHLSLPKEGERPTRNWFAWMDSFTKRGSADPVGSRKQTKREFSPPQVRRTRQRYATLGLSFHPPF